MADVSLNNLLKTQYLPEKINALPDLAILQAEAKFQAGARFGSQAEVPVILRRSGSFTTAASGSFMGTPTSRGFETGKAVITAYQFGCQENVSSSDAQRAASDKQAYDVWEKNVLTPSIMSFKARLEHYLLNGGLVGRVGSVSGTGPWTITVSDAFWADAVWAGAENTTYVDIFSAMTAGTTRGTSLQVTTVDFDNKQIIVAGTASGIAAGDYVFFEGTRGVVSPSMRDQLTNTGTIFSINAANYSLWKPTQHVIATTGKLTMTEALAAAAKAVGRGQLSEDCLLICNPTTAQNLATDQAALRDYDSSYKGGVAENGFTGVKYKAAAGFSIEVMAHPLCFPGEAYLVPRSALARYGSCDVTMGGATADGKELEPVFNHPTGFGLAFRIFTEQALAILCPAQCVRITNASGTAI